MHYPLKTTAGLCALPLLALVGLCLTAQSAVYSRSYTLQTVASFSGVNGANPYAGLTDVGGTHYGTTLGGGDANGDGTIFAHTPGGNSIANVAKFNSTDGANPAADLLDVGGSL